MSSKKDKLEKAKRSKPRIQNAPPSKRHKSVKDYSRKNKNCDSCALIEDCISGLKR